MTSISHSHSNATVELQYQGLLEKLMVSTLSTVPSCVFLYVNGTMLFSLRSKPVFCGTPRYVLLYNLLFADTVQLALSQVMYILAVCRVKLLYPVCGFLILLTHLTSGMSPLTLVLMSLERYVAVCYPLRHTTIITIRNTAVAITAVWAVSSLNNLTRLLLSFPFQKLGILQVKDLCSNIAVMLGSVSREYDEAFTCVVFVSAGVAITSSYISVAAAARSASADKTSARKARNTLLLHLVQLGLSLSSTIYNPLLIALSRTVTRIVIVRIQNVFYVCFVILPRCLSSLIYGLRDQRIRPVLIYHLCCRLRLVKGSSQRPS
ncbi:olfactory receptor 52N4-like [Stegastes partitus]|uniref:Olfactory receptor 52N4-like n=1 Tax=Stegastes partitus TaxID=144197 RepID=A0A9Y4U160_9TELE|nr:PREDICTED: olfactory receptor 52N4-like [Stegastes partitus]